MTRLARVALAVVGLDLSSKALADRFLSGSDVDILPWLHLHVVHNLQGAFGWSAGAYTWQLNLALTMCAVVFVFPVARDLARVDARSPQALGLIVGGALGNLASLVGPPAGVADFIALQVRPGHAIVLNLADIAAYLGLVLIMRTGFRLVGAIRAEAREAAAIKVGSVYAARDLVRGKRSERMVNDWSNVVDLGVVRGDGPAADDSRVPRPLGAVPRRSVRLVPTNELPTRPAVIADTTPE
ncbi:MAG: signal peptidase II [Gemmatimonadetes bacterium]|nr:signal peptidase II [Gemmatimonadota bacterium]